MDLFQTGKFTLHSDDKRDWKIECDALSEREWATIAWMMFPHLAAFGKVIGVPRGGHALARALGPYVMSGCKTLLVDDVLTTGQSMEHARMLYPGAHGAVVFATCKPPDWVSVLFQMRLSD